MHQEKINITSSFHSEIFGNKNENLESLKINFPKLKIVLRDEELKIIGDEKNVNSFMKIWDKIEIGLNAKDNSGPNIVFQ